MQHIPHVRLNTSSNENLVHTSGSWQSLEIASRKGLHISFTDTDAFVRDNRQYLFVSGMATKAWKRMKNDLEDASARQSVGCYKVDRTARRLFDLSKNRLGSMQEVTETPGMHCVCVEDFWPNQCMQSCLDSEAPAPKANVPECDCRLNCTRHLNDTTSVGSTCVDSGTDSDFDSDSDSDSDSESDSEIDPDSDSVYMSEGHLGPQFVVELGDYRGALDDWEALSNPDHEEHARQMPFWGCLTWQDVLGTPRDIHTQLQDFRELCDCIGTRKGTKTWSDV